MDRDRILKLIDIANKRFPPIVLIEGVSCVGKSFIIKRIKKELKSKKILVQHNPTDSALCMKLINWVKYNRCNLSPFALSCLYLIGQYELMEDLQKTEYREKNTDLVILDRSVFISGFIHQGYNGGLGLEACEKSLQLLSSAFDFFYKTDSIFLLTGNIETIAQRRREATGKDYKFDESQLDLENIFLEQECYIDFAKKINCMSKNFPEPQFVNADVSEEIDDMIERIKLMIEIREEMLLRYH